jgi:hypothetical protein
MIGAVIAAYSVAVVQVVHILPVHAAIVVLRRNVVLTRNTIAVHGESARWIKGEHPTRQLVSKPIRK